MSDLYERRGSSGAVIHIGADFVQKLDTAVTGTRVREQGLWLAQYRTPQLPKIEKILTNGYEMELLTPVDISGDPMPHIESAWRTYCELFNSTRGVRGQQFNRDELIKYVIKLCRGLSQYTIGLSLIEAITRIEWPTDHIHSWTHGDPIIDNLMSGLRDGVEEYVLIDPIPPTPALPSHPMVDWGRFIQSAAGYEQVRYELVFPDEGIWQARVATTLNMIVESMPYREFKIMAQQSLVYAVIGMLRGARTAPTPEVKVMICIQAQALVKELETWMR